MFLVVALMFLAAALMLLASALMLLVAALIGYISRLLSLSLGPPSEIIVKGSPKSQEKCFGFAASRVIRQGLGRLLLLNYVWARSSARLSSFERRVELKTIELKADYMVNLFC